MTEQIKPCPFCTEKYVTIATAAGGAKFITCVDCGADGPAATTEAEAIALWNAAPRPEPARTCGWAHVSTDYEDYYQTDCGQTWSLVDGDLADNGVVYCHHCGRRVIERPATGQESGK